MKKKIIGIVGVLLLISAGVLLVRHRKAELAQVPLPAEVVPAVETAPVVKGIFPETKRFLGTLSAKEAADLAPRVTGSLVEVRVREGAKVKKGDLLARLDDRLERDKVAEVRAELAAAQTALVTQEAIYRRDADLFAAKAISREAMDRSHSVRDAARARVTALSHELHTAKTNLSYTRITAPCNGVITARLADPGDLAVPGKPVLAMETPDLGYFVSVKVPQDLFPKLRVGGKAFLLPGLDGGPKLSARISRIHPAVRAGTLAVVELDVIPSPFGLPTGATLDVDLVIRQHQGWRVPTRALLENTDAVYLYRIKDDETIHIEKITLLSRGPEWAVVSGAIPEKARVVTAQESALLRLHEGETVRIVHSQE
ncbi:MAG: efflux RND transporter periplasmic adaptor subunit [Deltaproteobacteria bacterium]|nr:efflux RND transporter periplasmic adaptor subunit [Deltaproteobacteria bacterium]